MENLLLLRTSAMTTEVATGLRRARVPLNHNLPGEREHAEGDT